LDRLESRLREAQELLVLRHRLGLAADRRDRAHRAGDGREDLALGRLAAGLLARRGNALLAQEPLRRLDVAAGLLQRALGGHHPRACAVAELLDEACGDLHLAHSAPSVTGTGSGVASGAGVSPA